MRSHAEEGPDMIRNFHQPDTKQVMQLWLKGNMDAHPFIPAAYWKSNFEMVQQQLSQAEIYVYEEAGGIQGFIGVQENYIAGIFVKKECRCAGIGRQLLDQVKASHPALNLNVYEKNRRAADFYKREGFSITSKGADPDTGEMDIAMEWHGIK